MSSVDQCHVAYSGDSLFGKIRSDRWERKVGWLVRDKATWVSFMPGAANFMAIWDGTNGTCLYRQLCILKKNFFDTLTVGSQSATIHIFLPQKEKPVSGSRGLQLILK